MSGGGSLRTSVGGILAARAVALVGAALNTRREHALGVANLCRLLADGELAYNEEVLPVDVGDDALKLDGLAGGERALGGRVELRAEAGVLERLRTVQQKVDSCRKPGGRSVYDLVDGAGHRDLTGRVPALQGSGASGRGDGLRRYLAD